MAPNSRPPLTSRIRASFDGKRTKSEVTSPVHTNGFLTQDPESLRNVIDEAINSETFQKAIAANLAKLIKPSIKSALDTIQPVVEAVYSHELLLRKTNQSVEDILLRLDEKADTTARRESLVEPLGPEQNDGLPAALPDEEKATEGQDDPAEDKPATRAVSSSSPADVAQHKQFLEDNHAKTTSALPELSSSVEASNRKIAEALQGINDVDTKLRWTGDSIESLKTASEQSHTTMAVLQAQLDQLKEDIGQLMTSVGSDLARNVQALNQQGGAKDASLFDSHTTKLDAMSTDLAALKGQSDTVEKIDAVASELTSLKASVASGIASNSEEFTSLRSQINNVLSTLEGHSGTLGEIKDKGPHPDILTALQQSNDSHASHAVALGEIKDRSFAAAPAPSSNESGSPDTTAALQELKSDLATLRENIEAGFTSNSENVTSVGVKADNVLSTIEGHKASDPSTDILAAVQQSNESHVSHAAVLEELNSREGPSTDTSHIEAQLTTIVGTINTHTSTLEEIKAASEAYATTLESYVAALESMKSSPAVPESVAETETSTLAPLEAHMSSIVSILEEHSEALDEIKTATGAQTTALEGHGMALEGIKSMSVNTAPVAESVDLNRLEGHISDIIATLQSHTSALEDLKTASGAHTTALEQTRSVSDSVSMEGGNVAALESQISAIVATLQTHTTALGEISASNNSHDVVLGEIFARGQADASTLDEIKTAATSHASALEDIKSSDIPPIGATAGISLAGLEIQIGSIISSLDAQTAALKELKPQSPTGSTEVVSSAESDSNEGLGSIMTTIVETLEMHTMLLNEMKEDVSAEILTTLHDVTQTQINHTNLLTEIREADLNDEILTLLHASGESHVDHAAALEKIEAAVHASNESCAAHASSLEDIKLRSIDLAPAVASTVDLSSIAARIDTMVAALEEHKTTLQEIRGTTSAAKELHAGHTAALEDLKSRSVDPVAAPAIVDVDRLETKLDGVISALEEHKTALAEIQGTASASHELHAAHSAALDEIKSRSVEPTSTASVDLSSLQAQLSAITAALEEHKATLSEMKETGLASHELHTAHGASLEEIKSRPVCSGPAPVTDLSGLETQLTAVIAALEEHEATLAEVKATTLASHDLHTAHANTLDEVKSRSIEPAAVAPMIDVSGLEAQMGSINSSIDEIKAKSLEPASSSVKLDIFGLETQLADLTSMLEEHKATLSEIKSTGLASHDLHTTHTALLDEIKSRSPEPSSAPTVDISGMEAQLSSIAAALDEHKTLLSTVVDATAASNSSHLSHTAALSEIKDATLASNESHSAHTAALSDIKDATSSWNEAHSANAFTLAEIKDATLASNDSHLSHAMALDELKEATTKANEAHASHTAAFNELKSVQPNDNSSSTTQNVDLSPIEGHLTAIITTLEGHTTALSEIKEVASSANPELLVTANDSHDLLASHTSLLDAIKDSSSHEDILANISELKSIISEAHTEHSTLVKDLQTETKDSHSHITEAIGALAMGGAAGAGASALMDNENDSSEKVLSEVQALRNVLDGTREKMNSVAAQIDINHTTITTSITTLSDELKAEIDATGTHITDHILSLANHVTSLDLGPINSSVTDCAQQMKGINGKMDELCSSVKQTGSFVVGLYEGVHLNDTGVGQLQEQLVNWVVKGRAPGAETPPVQVDKEKGQQVPMDLDEAAWFKKRDARRAVSPSPLREVETVSPPVEPELSVEEVEKEEMPSIGAVLEEQPAPVVAEAPATEKDLGSDKPVAAQEIEPVTLEEAPGNTSDEPQAEADEPAVTEEEKHALAESAASPSDESSELHQPLANEPEVLHEEASVPEPMTEHAPVEEHATPELDEPTKQPETGVGEGSHETEEHTTAEPDAAREAEPSMETEEGQEPATYTLKHETLEPDSEPPVAAAGEEGTEQSGHAEEESRPEPESTGADSKENPSEEATELGEETSHEPERTLVEPAANEHLTQQVELHDAEHEPESAQAEPEQAIPGELGEAEEETKETAESHITAEPHREPPSSPFIEEPKTAPAPLLEAKNSHEEEPGAIEFNEPHPSPISLDHTSSLVHESAAQEAARMEADEDTLVASHEHAEAAMQSPIESHSVPHSDPHADTTPLQGEDENTLEDKEATGTIENEATPELAHGDEEGEAIPPEDEADSTHHATHHNEEPEDHASAKHDEKPKNEQDESRDPPAFSGGFA